MNPLFRREKPSHSLSHVVFECSSLRIDQEEHGICTGGQFQVCLEQAEGQRVLVCPCVQEFPHISRNSERVSPFQQLRLSSTSDQMKVYLSTVDDVSYNKLRQEQGLHVSFAGFADQLVTILEACRRGELHASINADNHRACVQFYEKRPFRNLIHLYLPISEAPVELVLKHINQTMLKLKEQHASHTIQLESLQSQLSTKEETNRGLREEIKRLKGALNEQENMVFARNMEEVKNLQHSLKNLNELKDNDERQLKAVIFGLQEKVERLTNENAQLADKCGAAEKRSESYHSEATRLKQQLGLSKDQIGRLQSEIDGQKTRDRKQELNLLDLKRQLKDARDKGNSLEKQRSDLIAELEAEKIVCQTKRQALQVATEEITKANDIILKQSREVTVLKKKATERAAVALKQEEIIGSLECELKRLRTENMTMKQSEKLHSDASKDVQTQLEEMKDFTNKLEEQYKQSK